MRQKKERPLPSWGAIIENGLLGLVMSLNGCLNLPRLREDDPFWYFLVFLAGLMVGCIDLGLSFWNGIRKWKHRTKNP